MRSNRVALSAEQKRLMHVVAEAINAGADVHEAVHAELGSTVIVSEINSVTRILHRIGFQRGQEPGSAIARLYDALETAARGEEWEPAPYGDDRY